MKPVKPSEARKDRYFQELEFQAKEAWDKFASVMQEVSEKFPLEDGYWDMRANGKLCVARPYEFEVVD
jgi:hypothetical protein